MELNERIASARQKLWKGKPFQRIRKSAPVRFLGWATAICGAHPVRTRVFLILLYRLLLDVLYLTVLSPLFAYSGFTAALRPLTYGCSLLAVVIFAPLIAELNGDDSASAILCTFLNYLYFIPLTSYFGCRGTVEAWFFLTVLLYWGLLLFWQFQLPVLRLKPLPVHHISVIMTVLTVCACLLVLFVSGRYAGFRFTLNFWDVYGIRAEAAGYRIPALLSYPLSMMKIILPVVLLYWLRKKKYLIVAVICVVYIFLFSIDALKSIFLFLFLALAGYLFYRRWMLRWAPGLFCLLTCASIAEEKALGSFYLTNFLIRRVMYVPAQLAEKYASFFRENPLNLFREGIMGKFSFEPIYSTTIPRVLGEYLNAPEMSANNGLLGDMFANLPVVLGLLVMPLILILCFRLLDLVSESLAPRVLLPFCVFFAITFINASWTTTLLSHGFLAACVLLYIFPKEEGLPQ